LLAYTTSLKMEESFGMIIEDPQVDSLDTEIVDAAFGAASLSTNGNAGPGGVRYLHLSGIGKIEKSVKV